MLDSDGEVMTDSGSEADEGSAHDTEWRKFVFVDTTYDSDGCEFCEESKVQAVKKHVDKLDHHRPNRLDEREYGEWRTVRNGFGRELEARIKRYIDALTLSNLDNYKQYVPYKYEYDSEE